MQRSPLLPHRPNEHRPFKLSLTLASLDGSAFWWLRYFAVKAACQVLSCDIICMAIDKLPYTTKTERNDEEPEVFQDQGRGLT